MNGHAQHSVPRRRRWPRSGENAPRRGYHRATPAGAQQPSPAQRFRLLPFRVLQNPHREASNIPDEVGNRASAHPTRRTFSRGAATSALAVAMVSAGFGAEVAVAWQSHRLVQGPVVTAIAAASESTASLPAGPIEQVAAKVVPSVVELQTDQNGQALDGSGIILTSDGLIVTNAHVVSAAAAGDSAASTMVRFADGRTAPFTVVGTDTVSDIAVVRAEGTLRLAPISLGSSGDLRVGQPVVAIGSPLGLDGTVTSGIISALNRPMPVLVDSEDSSSVHNAIQTDAPMNPGNSGGALVDMNGRLIGITSAIATLDFAPDAPGGSIGLGFAIPVDQANQVAQRLIATRTASPASLAGGR
jgi:putative serine protease PepD